MTPIFDGGFITARRCGDAFNTLLFVGSSRGRIADGLLKVKVKVPLSPIGHIVGASARGVSSVFLLR